MKFIVGRKARPEGEAVLLQLTDWDDWFKFQTQYIATYIGRDGARHRLGAVKIGEAGLSASKTATGEPGVRIPDLPNEFSTLPSSMFSLAQDVEFYENLAQISERVREEVLKGLREVAFDDKEFEKRRLEPVMKVSLMRDVSEQAIMHQFRRVAHGGAILTRWEFEIPIESHGHILKIPVAVDPFALPPTNVQVVVGRNGVGKSWLLNEIAEAVVDVAKNPEGDVASLMSLHSISDVQKLTNLVSVSFSAFDKFEPISVPQDRAGKLKYHYVGLKKIGAKNDGPMTLKAPAALAADLTRSVKAIYSGEFQHRWIRALHSLEADPIFSSIGIVDIFEGVDLEQAVEELRRIYKNLSSGHAIVLLTVTRLVQTVQERTLVLLDEPEAHLHPPLLSAFIRALSDLLTNRNGVAIVATHSPVILQEVPKKSVRKLMRSGWEMSLLEPRQETFGENVGTLTDEIFGLEVSATGYHKILADLVAEGLSYHEVLARLGGRLGEEGRAVLAAMLPLSREESHVEA